MTKVSSKRVKEIVQKLYKKTGDSIHLDFCFRIHQYKDAELAIQLWIFADEEGKMDHHFETWDDLLTYIKTRFGEDI